MLRDEFPGLKQNWDISLGQLRRVFEHHVWLRPFLMGSDANKRQLDVGFTATENDLLVVLSVINDENAWVMTKFGAFLAAPAAICCYSKGLT